MYVSWQENDWQSDKQQLLWERTKQNNQSNPNHPSGSPGNWIEPSCEQALPRSWVRGHPIRQVYQRWFSSFMFIFPYSYIQLLYPQTCYKSLISVMIKSTYLENFASGLTRSFNSCIEALTMHSVLLWPVLYQIQGELHTTTTCSAL